MSKKKFQTANTDPFQQKVSTSEADKLIFGEVDIPESGRIVAKPLPIMNIWPDRTQPRQIIPRAIHGGRGFNPAAMPDILGAWLEAIYDTGADIPVEDILLGKNRGSDKAHSLADNDDPIVKSFVGILLLASDIRSAGLSQAIGVSETAKGEYKIVWGERRWTAFHLLKMFLGDKYASIPAKITTASEWEIAKAQAAENFHQRKLTAIGVARQFAKLLILARKDSQEPVYDSWDALVVEGGCDRPYFAQVADGNKHPIPYGMGPEFERTLNISTTQMRQYRGLLKLTGDYEIDNALWDLGDEFDWAEGFMRDIAQHLDVATIRRLFEESDEPEEMLREAISVFRAEKKSQDALQPVTHLPDPTPKGDEPKSPFTTGTAPAFKFSDEVITPDGPGHIIDIRDNTRLVKLDSGKTQRYGVLQLSPAPQVESWFDKYVQNVAGKVGHVLVDFGEDCEIEYADGGRSKINKEYLSFVDKEEWVNALRAEINRRALDNMMNKYVRTFQGVAQVIRDAGNFVEVQYPDKDRLQFPKDDVTVVDKAEWDAAVAALKDAAEQTKHVYQVDDRVLVRVGMNQVKGTIRYIKPEQASPYGVYLDSGSTHYYGSWVLEPLVEEPKREYWQVDKKDGSDNANSLPPATPSSPDANDGRDETKPRDWVGKPALWNEGKGYKVPVFVQEFIGAGMLRVASSQGQQHEAHFSQLEAVETGGVTLSDFMSDDPNHDHSDLKGQRVLLTTGEVGTITEVNGEKLVLQFSEFVTGGALVEHIVEVLDDEEAEETKAITDPDTLALLRHIGHITRRENTVLKLLALTRQNAIDAYKAEQLVPDLQTIMKNLKEGFQELIGELEEIFEGIITEAEESAD